MHATLPLLVRTDFPPLARARLETVQANLGYVCNQACLHSHVNASPQRTETMSAETIGLLSIPTPIFRTFAFLSATP